MMELLLARGGGRGLIEETFLFGTQSGEDDRDGDRPEVVLVAGFKPSNGPFLEAGCVLKNMNENFMSYIGHPSYISKRLLFLSHNIEHFITIQCTCRILYLIPCASCFFRICFLPISSPPSKFPPPIRVIMLVPGSLCALFPSNMFELSNKELELVDILS